MSAHHPEVKIVCEANLVIFEGPEEKVQSAAAKLKELIMKIKEKRVNLPTVLLTFMNTSSVLSKYQTRFQHSLRSPVSLVAESELILSSVSLDALKEAETAVVRDLTESSVNLQGPAAIPPDLDRLKEILNKAQNEANRGELRVEVSFIPSFSGTHSIKVQLVGYVEHVNKLKELLQNYQASQVSTQEVVILQPPELVDCFDKILGVIGMKLTDVKLTASRFPNPHVLLSGPRLRVQETKQSLQSILTSMTLDTLTLDGPGVVQYFRGDGKESKELVESSCHVIIWEKQDVSSPVVPSRQRSISSISSISISPLTPLFTRRHSTSVGQIAINKINLEIKICSLEDEQVNVLVVPTHNKQLSSTNIGKSLLKKGGDTVQSRFDSLVATSALFPGGVLQVDASASLGCSKIFCVECLPWDRVGGMSEQALAQGLKRCLDLCAEKSFSSVAIPVIGPGLLLKYSVSQAVKVLAENIYQFASSAQCGKLTTIHIVIKPGYADSEESYHEVYKHLSLNMNKGGQANFGSLTSDLDDINITVRGGTKLQVVFGDITNETTDAVVNTTDFENFYNEGVCKDILTVAGTEVEAQLKTAKVGRGAVFASRPGGFPCKEILHVCGEKNASIVEGLMCSIINTCESRCFRSVAIPAICAGAGGLDPGVVAGAILRGIKTATSSAALCTLTTIRLVLIKINVFLAFKEEATQMFPTFGRRASAYQLPRVQQQAPLPLSADQRVLNTIPASHQSTFLVLGLTRKDVDDAKEKLKSQYNRQCSSHTFSKQELQSLSEENILELQQLVMTEGLFIEDNPSGNLTVKGMNDEVKKVILKFNSYVHGSLMRTVREKEEDELYSRVMWCILGQNGNWDRLPKTANYNLEKKDVAGGIVDAKGVPWQVDLRTLEVTTQGQQTKLKRLENLRDFTFPLYWDSMANGENVKVVELQSSSEEYKNVKEGFKRTAKKTVTKIKRVQNIHLRRAYEVQNTKISEKNKHEGGANEMHLYHGTTEDNCDSIMKTGFNRRFSGQNATSYGEGTYFAVNAIYSTHPTYSKPAADGSQLMFVVRVLTGVYTPGQSGMRVPPARNDQESHIRYDSVVDRMDRPNMFVVFHDDQAYPDYLITFK
ncbi:protein mono-ADP-ribosyltransferase PARP14 [Fundulus heteroclitus]|uniref:protein mono-ADP-ribosyltransferase PARP14 n=1 Tax=Fundulus heteroclitus TaxID=8078 RepID=UPI00165CA2B8|nr:protein mono-ADP-ribosyltransferase PARP14 [Fundulus heteroclitus]